MRRRAVLLLIVGSLALGGLLLGQGGESYDVVIRNGRVLDGTGNPWQYADIGIRAGRIVAMGRLGQAESKVAIDAAGLLVAPGFIDVHTHAGPGLAGALNHAQPLLAQGITTAIVNPDGGGPTDIAAQRANYEKLGTGVNVAMFVPHGSVRQAVLGMADGAPNEAELARMVDLVRQGMKAGAIGLSSGLYYAPGSYSPLEEVIAMARAAAEGGGAYQSHIRDESDYSIGLLASIDEVIRVAEEAKLPGIVTHMKALGKTSWGMAAAAVMRVENARARGVAVYADQYPYEASSTGLVGALVPRWAEVGGQDQLRKRLDGQEREKLAADIRTNIERRGGPHTLFIARYEPDPSIEGKNLAQLAEAAGKAPDVVVMDLLRRGDAGVVSFNMNDRDIEQIMRQPWTMTCTDGDLVPMGEGKPHPRGYGAFARKLRVYVRERAVIDWAFAVRSMTSLPATVYGMKDRGILAHNAWADILLFDPEKIGDRATYQEPHQLSQGILYALVNGELVIDQGRFTNKLPGKIVVPQRR
ncbi:MAG: amidohydrolase family protein [Acidobacteriota bacterium]